jgi:urate oxidase
VLSGIQDLVVLKSTDSEFKGFLKDEFTTLAETDDRILATSLNARWRHKGTDASWNASYADVRECLLSTFATTYSRALQETLHLMGSAVLGSQPGIAEIRFSAPNKHHFLVDFSGFDVEGLTNDGEVFIAADRPYGLIEAQVTRDDAPPAGDAWLHVPAFV